VGMHLYRPHRDRPLRGEPRSLRSRGQVCQRRRPRKGYGHPCGVLGRL